MKTKELIKFNSYFSLRYRFSSNEESKKNIVNQHFTPQDSVFDLSVAQKYIIGNIRSYIYNNHFIISIFLLENLIGQHM